MAFYGIEYRKRPSIDMFEAFNNLLIHLNDYHKNDI